MIHIICWRLHTKHDTQSDNQDHQMLEVKFNDHIQIQHRWVDYVESRKNSSPFLVFSWRSSFKLSVFCCYLLLLKHIIYHNFIDVRPLIGTKNRNRHYITEDVLLPYNNSMVCT